MRWDIALSSAAIAVSLIAIGTVLGVSTPGRVQQGIEIGNPESDPRPGLVLEKPLRDLNGQVVNQESLFLVYAGDCVGCAVNSVTDDKLPHKDYKVVAVAFSGTSKEVAKVKSSLSGRVL